MRLRLGSPREKKIRAPSPEEGTQDKLSKRMPMATRRLAGSLYPSAHLSMDSFSAPEDSPPELTSSSASPFLPVGRDSYAMPPLSYELDPGPDGGRFLQTALSNRLFVTDVHSDANPHPLPAPALCWRRLSSPPGGTRTFPVSGGIHTPVPVTIPHAV